MNIQEEIKKLEVLYASASQKAKETKGSSPEDMQRMMENMGYMFDNINRRMGYLSDAFYSYAANHQKGHLPAMKNNAQMRAALKACDMEDDYEVGKSLISVASTSRGQIVTAEYKKK